MKNLQFQFKNTIETMKQETPNQCLFNFLFWFLFIRDSVPILGLKNKC